MNIPEWFCDNHTQNEIESRATKIGYERALRQIGQLERGLDSGWRETEAQDFLKRHPHLLLGRHRTGHGTYAFSEVPLGNQYKMDWAVANGSSGGLTWELVELECPLKLPFRKSGHFSAAARFGIEQIQDWRAWLHANVDYAQRPKDKGGLGLYEINLSWGVVVVGRRADYEHAGGKRHYDTLRHNLKKESNIELISYDSFVESLRFRFEKSI